MNPDESSSSIDITRYLHRGPIAVCNAEIAAVLRCVSNNVSRRATLICEIYERRGITLKAELKFARPEHGIDEAAPAKVILSTPDWKMTLSATNDDDVAQEVTTKKRRFGWQPEFTNPL
ncbi:MAG: hypothetical protein UT33_C0009G0060 [Candidatus Peregrinibacteria bacterium GW2011_GWC2_39_14]|nr:MAG: hypothetical protein US92_C0005G0060 [Candidatus Peregrinibacteria bacterium GW2011_GWA2_38_36]KKR06609.1 MAG: hypothetical protein UT33_C0009G0060 [Candidatus Peregrinibacteria bacterium GW2011_GWC2_39_14]